MKEAKKDLFESIYEDGIDAICITTNGHWTLEGKAAMGGGCARVCADLWPQTSINLGAKLKENAPVNIPYLIGAVSANGEYIDPETAPRRYSCLIFSFPTINDLIEGARLDLIHQSCVIMMQYADAYKLNKILLPRPGSGIGGLKWADVKEVIKPILDDRFTIVSFDHEE